MFLAIGIDMLTYDSLSHALESAVHELNEFRSKGVAKGMGDVIQRALHEELGPESLREAKLSLYGGVPAIASSKDGWIDLVYPGDKLMRAVELKVVRMPRAKTGVRSALYDLGQMTLDYARIQRAKKLEGGNLVALLYGPIVEALSEKELARAFHNQMFIDYETSRRFADLRVDEIAELDEPGRKQRQAQIRVIRRLAWNRPFLAKESDAIVAKFAGYALISIPIVPIGRR